MTKLVADGRLTKLEKFENSYLARTDPKDVARVESRTFMCTENKSDSVPTPAEGVKGTLGNWAHADTMRRELKDKFSGCMTGRTMYVIPFSMGPVGSPLSKIGVYAHNACIANPVSIYALPRCRADGLRVRSLEYANNDACRS